MVNENKWQCLLIWLMLCLMVDEVVSKWFGGFSSWAHLFLAGWGVNVEHLITWYTVPGTRSTSGKLPHCFRIFSFFYVLILVSRNRFANEANEKNELRCKRGLCTKLHRAKPCTVPRSAREKISAVDSVTWSIATYSVSQKTCSSQSYQLLLNPKIYIVMTPVCIDEVILADISNIESSLFLKGSSFAGWCWVGRVPMTFVPEVCETGTVHGRQNINSFQDDLDDVSFSPNYQLEPMHNA